MPDFLNNVQNFPAPVLVVEDSATQAEVLRRTLVEKGYSVVVAKDGAVGLAMAKEFKPKLIISDIVMPEMNGFELCRRIKTDKEIKDIPVILLTQLSDPANVISGLECGADSFITKPYGAKHLMLKIKEVFSNHALQKDTESDRDIEIFFADNVYRITAKRRQILNLLLSIYESAAKKNDDLIATQKKLVSANEQLEASTELFTNIIERTVVGIVIVSNEGLVRYCNRSATVLLNRTEGKLLHAPFGFPAVPDLSTEVEITHEGEKNRVVEIRVEKTEWENKSARLVMIRDVTERRRAEEVAQHAWENAERIELLEKELRSLADLASGPQTGVTARMYGVVSLQEGFPDTFSKLTDSYGELMDLALEQQVYKVKHDISGRLVSMAETLGFYKAGPRDVVDIHTTTLKAKTRKTATVGKKKAYTGEGWIMVLELMGHLASFYRNRAQGTSAPTDQKHAETNRIEK
ncbi:MAG: response regulator [Syntrophales bacterium]|nr:response regulator [Syntrophales bacterium]